MTTSATTSATFGPRSSLRSFAAWGPPRLVRRSTSTGTTSTSRVHVSTTGTGIRRRCFRRRVACRRRGRRATRGYLSRVGRDPEADRGTARPHSGARGSARADAAVRHPAARHQQGHLRRGLGTCRAAARLDQRRADRVGPKGARPYRIRRTATHDRPARRSDIRSRDLPQPLGRVRAGSRRCGHRLGGQPHRSRRPHRGVHALGIDHFILSGQPHIEEAYWFAEGAGAVLRQRGLV